MSKESINEELVRALEEVPASFEKVSELLKKGADPVTAGCGGDGESVLHYAVRDQPCEIVKLLLDNSDYDVNHVSDEEFGPEPLINMAAENPDFRVFSMLINDYGADCPTEGCYNPIYYFLMNWLNSETNPDDVYRFLSEACHIDDQHIFWNAIRSNYLDLCKYMYEEKDVSLDEEDGDGYSAIHIAAQQYSGDALKWLVEDLGVSPESENSKGKRPIHIACDHALGSYIGSVIYLVKGCSVDTTIESDEGLLPVHCLTRSICWVGDCISALRDYAEKLNLDFTAESSDGTTALDITIYNRCPEMTKFLVKKFGKEGVEKAFKSAFLMGDEAKECVVFLVEECGFDLRDEKWVEYLEPDKKHGYKTPTMRLLFNQDSVDVFEYCFEQHYGAELPDLRIFPISMFYESVPFQDYLISRYGIETYIDYLLEEDFSSPWLAFCEASRLDDIALLEYLVEEKNVTLESCYYNDQSIVSLSPLHAAIKNGNLESVKYLVEKCRCNPRILSDDYGSTVFYATKQNQFGIVDYLVTECGLPALPSVFFFADRKEFKQAFAFIDKYEIDVDELFCYLCYRSNDNVFSFLKKLYSKYRIDLSFKDDEGRNSLVNSLICRHLNTVKWLVEECGEDLNNVMVDGKNVLLLAVQSASIDLVEYLIEECGFDANSTDDEGTPSLFHIMNRFCSEEEKYEMIHYLVRHGADINAPDWDNGTILHYIAVGKHCSVDLFDKLIEDGADYMIRNKDNMAPIHVAAEWGRLDIVQSLIEKHGVDANLASIPKKAPIHYAAEYRNADIVKWLIEKGYSKVNQIGPVKTNVLYYAVLGCCDSFYDPNKSLELVRWLVDRGAKTDSYDSSRFTPLHIAARQGSMIVVKYLVEECHMNPAIDKGRGTPAYWAYGNVGIVRYLHKKEKEFLAKQ